MKSALLAVLVALTPQPHSAGETPAASPSDPKVVLGIVEGIYRAEGNGEDVSECSEGAVKWWGSGDDLTLIIGPAFSLSGFGYSEPRIEHHGEDCRTESRGILGPRRFTEISREICHPDIRIERVKQLVVEDEGFRLEIRVTDEVAKTVVTNLTCSYRRVRTSPRATPLM